MQNTFMKGRPLEITDISSQPSGETNFIMVDRLDLLKTGFDEIKDIADLFITLEVQFYGEVSIYRLNVLKTSHFIY